MEEDRSERSGNPSTPLPQFLKKTKISKSLTLPFVFRSRPEAPESSGVITAKSAASRQLPRGTDAEVPWTPAPQEVRRTPRSPRGVPVLPLSTSRPDAAVPVNSHTGPHRRPPHTCVRPRATATASRPCPASPALPRLPHPQSPAHLLYGEKLKQRKDQMPIQKVRDAGSQVVLRHLVKEKESLSSLKLY